MAHAQLDDNYGDHPKIARLSDAAYRLHTNGIVYCSRQLTDGAIDAEDVRGLVRKFRPAALAELLMRGLWTAVEDQYLIHDYLDWNPSKAEVKRRREAARKRQQQWRDKHDS